MCVYIYIYIYYIKGMHIYLFMNKKVNNLSYIRENYFLFKQDNNNNKKMA